MSRGSGDLVVVRFGVSSDHTFVVSLSNHVLWSSGASFDKLRTNAVELTHQPAISLSPDHGEEDDGGH